TSESRPRDVPARPGEAPHRPERNRVLYRHGYNGDCRGRLLGRTGCCRAAGDEDINSEPDQPGRKVGQPVGPALRPPILDDDVLALNPREFTQPLPKRRDDLLASNTPTVGRKPYTLSLPRLLRPGAASGGNHGSQASQECAAVHSIT